MLVTILWGYITPSDGKVGMIQLTAWKSCRIRELRNGLIASELVGPILGFTNRLA